MDEQDSSWDQDPVEEPDDVWFRPVWAEDDEDEVTPPGQEPWPLPSRRTAGSGAAFGGNGEASVLLGPLAAAADALARLDAQAALLSPSVCDGLRTRLAYAEAAGWLAAQGFVLHPLDLALREAERFDRRDLYARATTRPRQAFGGDALWLPLDDAVTRALHLARLLRREDGADPLADAASASTALGWLGDAEDGFDEPRFAAWRTAHLPARPGRDSRPALLHAADAAEAWMIGGITARPSAAQALAAAHLVLQRYRLLRHIPLLLWAGWPALGAPLSPDTLPRLRGDVAARLQPRSPQSPAARRPTGLPWAVVFLAYAAEAARAGSRTLASLRAAATVGAAFAAQEDRRSQLPATLQHLLHNPAVTAASLARSLGITPQAALRLLTRIGRADLVQEITGRQSFRLFALAPNVRQADVG